MSEHFRANSTNLRSSARRRSSCGPGRGSRVRAGDRAAKSHCQGVGGVRGHLLADPEKAAHHGADLLLRRRAVAGRRELDLLGAVFANGEPVKAAGHDRRAAGLAELQGRGGILREKHLFDGRLRGSVEADHGGQLLVDAAKPVREGVGAVGPDDAPGHDLERIPGLVDDPVPGPPGARIDADDPRARDLIGLAVSFPQSAYPQQVEAYLEGTVGWRPVE